MTFWIWLALAVLQVEVIVLVVFLACVLVAWHEGDKQRDAKDKKIGDQMEAIAGMVDAVAAACAMLELDIQRRQDRSTQVPVNYTSTVPH